MQEPRGVDTLRGRGPARKPVRLLVGFLALTLLTVACEDGPTAPAMDGSGGLLSMLQGDASTDVVKSAVVSLERVVAIPERGPPVRLETTLDEVDLLAPAAGMRALLAREEIASGNYAGLHLVVSEAAVELEEGWTFPDGSSRRTVTVPRGARRGLPPVTVGEGEGARTVQLTLVSAASTGSGSVEEEDDRTGGR